MAEQDNVDPRIQIARENLRMLAAKRRLNLSVVSRQAGMSRNGLGQFINGRTTLSYSNMLKVCDVLSVPIALVHQPEAYSDQKIEAARLVERLSNESAATLQEILLNVAKS